MKRKLTVLLSVILLAGSFPQTVFATLTTEPGAGIPVEVQDGSACFAEKLTEDALFSAWEEENSSLSENEQSEDYYEFGETDNEAAVADPDAADAEPDETLNSLNGEEVDEEDYSAAEANTNGAAEEVGEAGESSDGQDPEMTGEGSAAGSTETEEAEDGSTAENKEIIGAENDLFTENDEIIEAGEDPAAESTETVEEEIDSATDNVETVETEDNSAESTETVESEEDPAAGSTEKAEPEDDPAAESIETGNTENENLAEKSDTSGVETNPGENAVLTEEPVVESAPDEDILSEEKQGEGTLISGQFYYEEEDGKVRILGRVPDIYYNDDGDIDHEDNLGVYHLTIPASINGSPVTYIEGFDDCDNLRSVSLPEGLEEIGMEAFSGCQYLTQITLPSSLKGVYAGAFQYTGLTSVTIPAGTETRGYVADNGYLPGVFNGCDSLSVITFEDGMTEIARGWCWGCTGLKRIQFPSTVKSIGFRAFADCGSLTEIVIPEGVETIYYYAFEDCTNLEKVTFPASLQMVEYGAFMNTGLTSVTIPAGVKTHDFSGLNSFYTGVFEDCSKLKSITFEEGTEEVSNGWCANCPGLEIIVFPSSLKTIGERAFLNCDHLSSIDFPAGLETIAKEAFSECDALTELNLPSSLLLLGIEAFSCCENLSTVNIPKNMKTADLCGASEGYRGPFYNCENLKNVVFDPGIEEIPAGLFYSRTGIESIEIPDSVKSIAYSAFCYCEQLTTIHWGKGITSIGDEAFYGCTALTTLELPSTLTFIDRDAFACCENLTTVKIPKNIGTYDLCGVNSYYRGPFSLCENLTDVIFEEGMTVIPRGLFYGGTGIKSVTLPDSVTEIEYSAFAGCGKLKDVFCGKNLELIGEEAFWQCTELNAVHVPEKLKTVCRGAFSECGALADVYYGGTKEGWEKIDIENENDLLLAATLHPEKVQPPASVKYKITFNANGGEIKSGSKTVKTLSKSIEKGKKYGTLPSASRSGYYLSGWYTAKTGGNKVTASTKAEKKATVYARWVKGGKITYKLNGGTNNTANPNTYKSSTGITFKDPSRKGYTFKGWFSDSALRKQITGFKKGTTGNKTVYAKWAARTYTIKFDGNGGKGSIADLKAQYGKNVQLSANRFSKKDHTFLGWSTSKTAKKADYKNKATVKNLSTGKTVTLYAIWKLNSYKIVFYDNFSEMITENTGGGASSSFASATMTCYVNKTYTLPLEFSHTGYTFTGWSKTKGGKIVYKNKATVKNLSGKNGAVFTLYANWKANTYTVKFDGNGGKASKAMADLSCTFGKKAALPANTFKLTGYKFKGWALRADGDVKYKNKASISNLTSKNKGVVTLYAQWGYTVNYIANNDYASGVTNSTERLKGHGKPLSAPSFTVEQGHFEGWNTKQDGTGTTFLPGDTSDIKPDAETVVKLYALWSYVKYPHMNFMIRSLLDNPFYQYDRWINGENHGGDCAVASIAIVRTMQGNGKTASENYNDVWESNGRQSFIKSWADLGIYQYWDTDLSLDHIYNVLRERNAPVIICRSAGKDNNHFSVIYGYNGNVDNLEMSGFMVYEVKDEVNIPGLADNLEKWAYYDSSQSINRILY